MDHSLFSAPEVDSCGIAKAATISAVTTHITASWEYNKFEETTVYESVLLLGLNRRGR